MKNTTLSKEELLKCIEKVDSFSGVIVVEEKGGILVEEAYGFANKGEEIPNNINTRFGIASGCKIFTSVAICQLVEKGLVTFDTPLRDCVKEEFPNFDPKVTIHQLLTHTSGIPDYFDEDIMEDFAVLWEKNPMYNLKKPKDFLSMFANKKMKFSPGERFHYNNGGYILLGLVVEAVSGLPFTEYVEKNIFQPCGMMDSGYFSFDQLPKNTALGYIHNEKEGTWKSNIYSLPIVGGPDGGAYVTDGDMLKFWKGLMEYKLLSKDYTEVLLKPHVLVGDDVFYYGYGVWMKKDPEDTIFKYYVMGFDPGVNFRSTFYPKSQVNITILGNTEYGTHVIANDLEDLIFQV